MSGQIQAITTALLILMLQTTIILCSKIDTETVDEWVRDPHLPLTFIGYLGDPAPLRAPTPGNVSQACQRDLYQLLNISSPEFKNEFKALDAFGKPGAGFMEGNLAWLGNYDECMSLEGFNYCLANLAIKTNVFLQIPQVMIHWGICPPASCSGEDVMNALQDLLGVLDEKWVSFKNISAAAVSCTTSPHIPYSSGFICTVILLSVIGILMVGGSLYDEYLKLTAKKSAELSVQIEDKDDVPFLLGQETSQPASNVYSQEAPQGMLASFLLCFAATRNLSKLLDIRQKDTSISSLNGIRFISMTWVILGHTLVFIFIPGTAQNPAVLYDWLVNDFGFQVLANAFFSVDSFFLLSGCLISYLTLNRMRELNTVKAWGWFYFHRYLRLTPVVIVTTLVWMYIQPFFGDSPVWQASTVRPLCQKYWWTNLLYINNFYPKMFAQECIAWTWYLANDMQFFIISPLIIVPLYYAPVFGWVVLSCMAIVSMVITAVLLVVYNLSVDIIGQLLPPQPGEGLDFNSLVYAKPYCRITPYLVGIGLGYIMYKTGKRKVKMSPLLALAGWVLAAGIGMSVVYGLYPTYQSDYNMTRAAEVVYGAVSRFAWAIAIAWVIFACKYGYGGWINGFLSWTGWIPLSRLTFTAYMFHPIIVVSFYSNFGTSIFLSKYLLAFYFAGILAMSYFVALFVALAVEYPFANLEKLLMPNSPKERCHGDQMSRDSIISQGVE